VNTSGRPRISAVTGRPDLAHNARPNHGGDRSRRCGISPAWRPLSAGPAWWSGRLAKAVFSIHDTESDPDGTLLPRTVRGQVGPAGVTTLGHSVVSRPRAWTTWPSCSGARRSIAQRTRWGDLLRSPIGRACGSPQGHAKGTPTYHGGLIPPLTWAFGEPNPSNGYVWEIMVNGPTGVFYQAASTYSRFRLVERRARQNPWVRSGRFRLVRWPVARATCTEAGGARGRGRGPAARRIGVGLEGDGSQT
jgi:hypothetical protein